MQVYIKPNTYIFLTILLFTVPFRWIISWLTAIAFHELCHYLAVRICRGRVYSFTVGLGGADMQCSNMSDSCRLLAFLSGPIGGLLLVLFGRYMPRVAICSFVLSVYNLVPLLPFDGGRALMVLVKNEHIFCVIQNILLLFIFIVSIFAVYYFRLGIFPLLITIGILLKNRKTPCKEDVYKLQ